MHRGDLEEDSELSFWKGGAEDPRAEFLKCMLTFHKAIRREQMRM